MAEDLTRPVRLIYPHQLFEAHLDAAPGTRFVLVEDDLLFRHQPVHAQRLVLHRAAGRSFAERLRGAGFDVDVIETDAGRSSSQRLTALLRDLRPGSVRLLDPVDDWMLRDVRAALAAAGVTLEPEDVEESPGFLTTRPELVAWFGEHRARMQTFYQWQRRRLGVLVEGDQPVGGRWSFDTENRKKLPKGHVVPERTAPSWTTHVEEAVDWVGEAFPDAPGSAASFAWPVTHEQARAGLREFVAERLEQFGPYEDAVATAHPFVFHAAITPALNCGLLTPHEVLEAVLAHADEHDVPIESLEGFVRQLIGWREYMRATYHLYGRRMRSANHLRHTRSLAPGWWDGTTGLEPVDHVVRGVLERGYAHHIERLMVLGNAMCLLRTDPEEVYEWFMAMFVDAYDWVMVPNVYAMSQFAAGTGITTKPYVSGSNYLRKMTDVGPGEWRDDWDALYWRFVEDHREVFEGNPRSRMVTRTWEGMDPGRREELLTRGQAVIRRL
ncbi:cryptochrome/photolyase family protein [Oryzobacter terrae]|uniref:cryptochrome/photolyase family protein n=1 Tax=Oryzobacter terrae TaxID=1620385 RepID=UPI00366B1068